jgi:CII-binding regulator of phage lambda lysogenization HflD
VSQIFTRRQLCIASVKICKSTKHTHQFPLQKKRRTQDLHHAVVAWSLLYSSPSKAKHLYGQTVAYPDCGLTAIKEKSA